MPLDLPATVRASIAAGGAADAIAFGGRWRSWAWLCEAARAIDEAIGEAPATGLVARNRPQHVAAFAAGVMARRATVMLYAAQTPAGLAADIAALRLPAILADAEDWSDAALAAAREAGTAAIAIHDGQPERIAVRLAPHGQGPFRTLAPDTAFELLSSGTTGAPKRVPLSWDAITAVVASAQAAYAGTGTTGAPQVMVHPLGNVAGLAYVTPPIAFGQRLVLLEKFEVATWADAVRRYRPARGTIPPAGVRMLLDSDVPREDLASLGLVAVGGGKLDIALHEAFEARFGIPILTAFGATEFGGVIANWTLDLYRAWGAAKRGSAGRASAGVALRTVDLESFTPLPPGEIGLLEARVDRIGPDWIRTTDLASIDADGFLFLHGRADAAINRGGFKVVPEMVAEMLKAHPDVADAAVVGVADARLGELPVAAVELRRGGSADGAALRAWLKDRLVAYQVPAEIRVVSTLPRNASMKISLADVKALFA
ncbi:ANL family adenylate-forming protein [Flavisphingomonas formosensis]|uniref:ANL family adenylate-forming protein n=1 Tax=Flavisphingomonas formosensis TaxID=861534 RepID=UPI0018DFAF83|nr:fatty acid--CoA ligase family protein [Sphingomonas formosensis]